jgi:tetratricopeptide (TPR) repeat protein
LQETQHAAEAVGPFEELRRRQPDNPAVLLGLAKCRRQLGQPDEARQLLDAVLAQNPEDAQALAEQGKLALAAGQASEAEAWLRRAAERAPRDREIVYNFVQCLRQLGKDDEADRCAALLKEIDADQRRMNRLVLEVMQRPRDAELRYEAGMIFLRNGLTDDGLSWLAMALENDPRHRRAREALAEHYERSGRPDLAAPHREALRQLGAEGPP